MDPLEPPDSHYLRAAMGWLELGNPREAGDELERIAARHRGHPAVLEVRWHLCAQTRQWEVCVEIATAMTQLEPAEPEPWIWRAFALHELKRTAEALTQLLPIVSRFPEVWTIPYNLACYCAQLGRLDEGEAWFRKAWAINAAAAAGAAKSDPDLGPIRARLRRLWKRSE